MRRVLGIVLMKFRARLVVVLIPVLGPLSFFCIFVLLSVDEFEPGA
jgi:hypothetical protein